MIGHFTFSGLRGCTVFMVHSQNSFRQFGEMILRVLVDPAGVKKIKH